MKANPIHQVAFLATEWRKPAYIEIERGYGPYNGRTYKMPNNNRIGLIERLLREKGFNGSTCVFHVGIAVRHYAPDSYKSAPSGPLCEICHEEVQQGEGYPHYTPNARVGLDAPIWMHSECYNKLMQEGV